MFKKDVLELKKKHLMQLFLDSKLKNNVAVSFRPNQTFDRKQAKKPPHKRKRQFLEKFG